MIINHLMIAVIFHEPILLSVRRKEPLLQIYIYF